MSDSYLPHRITRFDLRFLSCVYPHRTYDKSLESLRMPEFSGGPELLPIPCKHYMISCSAAAPSWLQIRFNQLNKLGNHARFLLNRVVPFLVTTSSS